MDTKNIFNKLKDWILKKKKEDEETFLKGIKSWKDIQGNINIKTWREVLLDELLEEIKRLEKNN